MNHLPLILASSSAYRRALLARLGLPFDCVTPDCNETPLENESAPALAARLALLKAKTVAKTHPEALIIGSDQVAAFNNSVLGKPGDHPNAVAQLSKLAGKTVYFYTALALLNAKTGVFHQTVETVEVKFKPLSPATIDAYLHAEKPYDCAGAFKSEGLGIILFEHIRSDDPTALIGLPLIKLCQFLEKEGVNLV